MQSILFLSVMNGSAWGGSEVLWNACAIRMAKDGYKVGVCCFDWDGKEKYIRELKDAGCEIYLVPGRARTEKRKLWNQFRLARIVSKIPLEKYDLAVVNQGGWKDVSHGPFKKAYRRLRNYVLLFHNYNVHERYSAKRAASMKQWVTHARKNIGDTHKIFQAMEQTYSTRIPNQEKLFNPLTFPAPATPAPYPATNGMYRLSVFAALDTGRKAQDVLIKALANEYWKDQRFELFLYGEGQDRAMLETLIHEHQLQNKLFLKGNAPDYKQAIAETHLVLQITHIDAMPITVMDALSMARPIVISNVGDMPNWIEEGENGWMAAAVTPEAIDETLKKAWAAKDNWEQMGMRSFELFQQKFPVDPVEHFIKQLTDKS